MIEKLRSAVRPLVTFAFVAALIVAAFIDEAAVPHIKEPALIVIAFWFGQRVAERENGAS